MYNNKDLNLPNEIWKPIPDYEGIYEASSLGRIRTCEGKTTSSTRYEVRHWKSKIIKYRNCTDVRKIGYRVSLWKNKKPKDFLIARLVCSAFYGKSDLTVNHKDGNRLNNCIENLEWLSLGDNIRHGFETGLYHSQKQTALLDNNGVKRKFRSLSQASLFLGRNVNYINTQIKRNNKITDINGNLYFVNPF